MPLVLFVLFQELARDNWYFLELTFSSFIFLGFVSFQLFRTPVEQVSRNQKWAILTLTLISLIVAASVAVSLVIIPRGGRHDSLQISPHDVEGTVFDVNPDPEVGAYYFDPSGDPCPYRDPEDRCQRPGEGHSSSQERDEGQDSGRVLSRKGLRGKDRKDQLVAGSLNPYASGRDLYSKREPIPQAGNVFQC